MPLLSCGTVAVASAAAAAALTAHRRLDRWRRRCRGSCRVSGGSRVGPLRAVQPSKEEPKQSGTFGFESGLVKRFLEIAEPYFVEGGLEQGGAATFALLLFAMLVGVAGVTFLLVTAGLAAFTNIPTLAALVPSAAAKLEELAVLPYFAASASGIAFACGVFAVRRQDFEGRWQQWGYLGLLIFLLLCVTLINVVVSYVFRSIDNVLVAKNEPEFYNQMTLFVGVLVVAVPTIAFYRFMRMTLARNWREFLTVFMLDRYFQARTYYMLDSNSTSTNIDNPDQRISEDISDFTTETLGFLLDILGSVSNLISFSAILWATSEQLTFALIVYALLGTVIALSVGGELIGINYKQIQLQADFRYSLVHVRDNAEAIAFYQGEAREQESVVSKLQAALRNYDQVITWTAGLTIYQKVFFYVARLVPYFVVGGLYFAGQVDFGTFGQVSFAFSMVLSSVTLIVSRIQDISRFSAGVNRLGTFYEAIVAADREMPYQSHGGEKITTVAVSGQTSERVDSTGGWLELEALTLWTPTGRTLVEDVSFELGPATGRMQLPSRLLVVGSSGVGKSSILRAVAGLWTQGRGRIRRPDIAAMLFLPQKPYMPLGDLRMQLIYPTEVHHCPLDDNALIAVLQQFGLGELPSRFEGGFDAVQDWSRVLSLGEQQRLAAARCLVREPAVAVLDEATSALPVADERHLYMTLQERGIGYISVGHRPSLVHYHDLVLELQGQGRWRLMSPREYEEESMAAAAPALAPAK